MNAIKVIGIDLAKFVFQVCVWMSDAAIASNRKRRGLAVVLDLFSRKPIGWVMSFLPDSVLMGKVLTMA
ncbi:Putative transposase [Yersinia aldovae]|nr:Putative transposase [Yersinia aldovae]